MNAKKFCGHYAMAPERGEKTHNFHLQVHDLSWKKMSETAQQLQVTLWKTNLIVAKTRLILLGSASNCCALLLHSLIDL